MEDQMLLLLGLVSMDSLGLDITRVHRNETRWLTFPRCIFLIFIVNRSSCDGDMVRVTGKKQTGGGSDRDLKDLGLIPFLKKTLSTKR